MLNSIQTTNETHFDKENEKISVDEDENYICGENVENNEEPVDVIQSRQETII